jgi:hypothetical protein
LKPSLWKLTIAVLAACLLSAPGFFLAQDPAFSAAPRTGPLGQPEHGWSVCAVLYLDTIPGVPDQRQVFELCHNTGWRLQVYCLNPGVPYPALGAQCSEISEGRYWCGDGVQELQVYGVLQTPPATLTPTPTSTLTSTATPPPSTLTPTPPAAAAATATTVPVPYSRPRAGGPGSLDLLVAFSLWVVLITATLALGWRARLWYERTQPR